ncbi:hypothetical protein [Streptomyces silvisoli]|uniref:Serine kinase n=1 Tax=Streptomyces silvisoli TaxID=3034235 RepID=A0ABT5ZKT7_9ACTN|nr:hypothetical protein [Streptomyces silvisoli]MDF3290306.1 hypothetical protein [Streptomyces silvisoli]
MSRYERAAAQAVGTGTHDPVEVRWGTVVVRVHTSSAWVRHYVADQHHLVEPRSLGGVAPHTVDLFAVADAALLADVKAHLADRAAAVREAFAGESYRFAQLAASETALLADRPTMYDHALLTRDFLSWVVLAARSQDLGLLVTRTIREIVREDLLARGAVMFHAGAAELSDKHGLFLAGPSGAGKTSAALRAALGGGLVVGTDRTLLLAHGGQWFAVGLPMSTRLGPGSASALGIASAMDGHIPIRSTLSQPGTPQSGPDKLSLSNAEVYAALGCGFTPTTPIESLLVLQPSPDVSPRVTDVDPAEAVGHLAEHLLSPDPAYRSRWLAAQPDAATTADPRALAAAIVAQLPVAQVVWDPVLHCDDGAATLLSRHSRRSGSGLAVGLGGTVGGQ